MSQTALLTIEEFIRGTLIATPAVTALVDARIYRNKARSKAIYPCVVFAYQQGTDRKIVGGARFTTSAVYAIRAISQLPVETADEADAIAAEVDAVLDGFADGAVLQVMRESPLEREYTIDGIDYEERGGLYRFLISGG